MGHRFSKRPGVRMPHPVFMAEPRRRETDDGLNRVCPCELPCGQKRFQAAHAVPDEDDPPRTERLEIPGPRGDVAPAVGRFFECSATGRCAASTGNCCHPVVAARVDPRCRVTSLRSQKSKRLQRPWRIEVAASSVNDDESPSGFDRGRPVESSIEKVPVVRFDAVQLNRNSGAGHQDFPFQ